MAIFTTKVQSWTGKMIYSDTYAEISTHNQLRKCKVPLLNRLAAYPIIGIVAGIIRIALSIIHIIGHLAAALLAKDKKGHLYHVIKGGAELLRGVIEATPILGRIFVWKYDVPKPFYYTKTRHRGERTYAFFLIKMYNPDKPDDIDNVLYGLA